jgi:hypothetical protein
VSSTLPVLALLNRAANRQCITSSQTVGCSHRTGCPDRVTAHLGIDSMRARVIMASFGGSREARHPCRDTQEPSAARLTALPIFVLSKRLYTAQVVRLFSVCRGCQP